MLSDTATLVLLVFLIAAALVVIGWAWRTREQDGPAVNTFVRPARRR